MAEMRSRHAIPEAKRLSSRLPALLAEARRVASSVVHGTHGRRRPGTGDDFWQFRPQSDGDSYQDIDWRQSAKSTKLYVRDKEWEIAQTAWLWCDTSPSMYWTGDVRSRPDKAWAALVISLALTDLLLDGGERVGVLGGGMRPVAGSHGLEQVAGAMDQVSMEHALSVPPSENRVSRHTQIVLVSDFLEDIEALELRLRRFAAIGVVGHLVQVLDPFEETLPFKGRTEFEGLEGEGRIEFGKAQTVAEDYAKAMQTHRDRLQLLARRIGWYLTVHHTDKPPHLTLLALSQALAAARMGGRG